MKKKLTRSYNNKVRIYKRLDTCAGLNCSNKPVSKLKVRYVNKTGYFCQRCTDDLLRSELAEEIISQGVGGGV